MSDKEALKIFSRQPVSQDMVNFLVATTNSIIQVKPLKRNQHHRKLSSTSSTIISPYSHSISLTNFIKKFNKLFQRTNSYINGHHSIP